MARTPAATPTASPASEPGAPPVDVSLCLYRVTWTFLGFRTGDLSEGDTVEASAEEAAPFTGPGGVLSLVEG